MVPVDLQVYVDPMSGFSQCVLQKIMIFTFGNSNCGILSFENFETFKISIPQIRIQNIPLLQKIDKLAVSKLKLYFCVIYFLID